MSLANWINERNQLGIERARLIAESKKKIDQINKRLDELDVLSSNYTRYGIDTMKVYYRDSALLFERQKEDPEIVNLKRRVKELESIVKSQQEQKEKENEWFPVMLSWVPFCTKPRKSD